MLQAQTATPKVPAVDKSPMDMSYFPDQYPIQKIQGKAPLQPTCRVIYGRPKKEGRTIFGDLVKYNEIWRIGANESTEIEFFKNVTINGKAITKGKYSLFCIPDSTNWNFILNKDTDCWGAFTYSVKKDAVRISSKVIKLTDTVETLSIYFTQSPTGAKLNVAWDNYMSAFDIKF